MAVERMKLLNIVLPRDGVFRFLKEMILNERVEFVDARKMIDETSFLLSTQVENAERIQELNDVAPFRLDEAKSAALAALDAKFEELRQRSGFAAALNEESLRDLDLFFEAYADFEGVEKALSAYLAKIEELDEDMNLLRPYQQLAAAGIDFPLGKLFNMKNFKTCLGWIDESAIERLSRSAGELPPLFVKLARDKNRELCVFIYPHELETESGRVIRSLRLEELQLAEKFRDLDLGNGLQTLLVEKREERAKWQALVADYLETNRFRLDAAYSQLLLEKAILAVLANVGCTEHYVYLSLWTPADRVASIAAKVEKEENGVCLVLSSREAKIYELAPTSLKNAAFFRPFEKLVGMYGTPSYKELDPTPFFAVVYMLLFGIMFGDLGQGMVFLVAGLVAARMKHRSMGGLLGRLGLASMTTGFFYDSFFGYEGLISGLVPLKIFFRPFENTNRMLLASVVLGLLLLAASYLMGVVNRIRLGEFMEAFLGKEGLCGFFLFASFVLAIPTLAGFPLVPSWVFVTGMVASSLLIFLHQPLYRLIVRQHPLFDGKSGDYYVENGFNLMETFLGLLSNSLSFIRVGAFALNHVGLFLAFHTLARMLNSAAGNVAMAILGNVIILGLEGLIVFIQDLRLMYYELFSKFFKGEGREFKPARLKEV